MALFVFINADKNWKTLKKGDIVCMVFCDVEYQLDAAAQCTAIQNDLHRNGINWIEQFDPFAFHHLWTWIKSTEKQSNGMKIKCN